MPTQVAASYPDTCLTATPIKVHAPINDDVVLLQEVRRPDDSMPMKEDEHSTYIMNSKNLRAIEHIEHLTKMGVDSFNRGYTDGFYERRHDKKYQLYMRGYSLSGRSLYVGETLDTSVGDKIEIIEPQGNRDLVLEKMWNMSGEPIDVAPGSGHFVWIEIPMQNKHAFIARYALNRFTDREQAM